MRKLWEAMVIFTLLIIATIFHLYTYVIFIKLYTVNVQFIASQLYLNKPVFKISHDNHSLARTLMSNFSPGIVISLLYSLMCSAKEGLNI